MVNTCEPAVPLVRYIISVPTPLFIRSRPKADTTPAVEVLLEIGVEPREEDEPKVM